MEGYSHQAPLYATSMSPGVPGCSNDEGVGAATLGNEVKQTFSLQCETDELSQESVL